MNQCGEGWQEEAHLNEQSSCCTDTALHSNVYAYCKRCVAALWQGHQILDILSITMKNRKHLFKQKGKFR